MMNYIIKNLAFKKDDTKSNTYVTNVKIHDILNIKIEICKYNIAKVYDVYFTSVTGYKCFDMPDDEPCSYYSKCGFESFNDAYDYANKEMKRILGSFISSLLVDIDDYIEEIGEI